MSSLITNIFYISTAEVDKIRNELLSLDVAWLSLSPPRRDSAARVVASSYVWLAAILENYMTKTVEAMYLEINNSGVMYNQLKPSLFSIVCDSEFTSLRDSKRSKSWKRRIDVFDKMNDTNPVLLNMDISPLDGRTIRPEHLEALWLVFHIRTPCLTSPRLRLALRDLADGRNEVAHGRIDPVSFGRRKVIPDVVKLTNYVDEVILHVTNTVEFYIDNREYIK